MRTEFDLLTAHKTDLVCDAAAGAGEGTATTVHWETWSPVRHHSRKEREIEGDNEGARGRSTDYEGKTQQRAADSAFEDSDDKHKTSLCLFWVKEQSKLRGFVLTNDADDDDLPTMSSL